MNKAKRGGPGRGFWLALGLLAMVGIGALAYVASRPKASVAVDPNAPPIKAEGYVLGSPTAPVEVVEFADFECPGCGQFATIAGPDIKTNLVNTGKIRIRLFDFPLPQHKNSPDASLAAACASDQGKFWEMHDQIFNNQDQWSTQATSRPRPLFANMAKAIGLDMSKYEGCMDSNTHQARIQSHLQEATRRQVQSTPSFIIGGRLHSGALPYDQFKSLVDAELAKVPAVQAPAGQAPAGQTPAGRTDTTAAGGR